MGEIFGYTLRPQKKEYLFEIELNCDTNTYNILDVKLNQFSEKYNDFHILQIIQEFTNYNSIFNCKIKINIVENTELINEFEEFLNKCDIFYIKSILN